VISRSDIWFPQRLFSHIDLVAAISSRNTCKHWWRTGRSRRLLHTRRQCGSRGSASNTSVAIAGPLLTRAH
jgi:hypothetical protein